MEFVVDVDPNPGIFLEVLREMTTLLIAERELHVVLESTVAFLDLGLFSPVQLGEDFDVLMVKTAHVEVCFSLRILRRTEAY